MEDAEVGSSNAPEKRGIHNWVIVRCVSSSATEGNVVWRLSRFAKPMARVTGSGSIPVLSAIFFLTLAQVKSFCYVKSFTFILKSLTQFKHGQHS